VIAPNLRALCRDSRMSSLQPIVRGRSNDRQLRQSISGLSQFLHCKLGNQGSGASRLDIGQCRAPVPSTLLVCKRLKWQKYAFVK
jgi:hypothetical protein